MSNIEYKLIRVSEIGHVMYLTINRPVKRNAFTPNMISEIYHALSHANNNSSIWLIVINAEGPVFCAGMDMAIFQKKEIEEPNYAIESKDLPIADVINIINKPIISVVDGPVIAGGMLFIAESTFVIATEKASFSLPEVKRGIFPFQVMSSLTKILPIRKIMEICILAKEISPDEAYNLGIVSQLVDSQHLEKELDIFIEKILNMAPYAIAKGIEVSKTLSSIADIEKQQYLKNNLEQLRNTADAKEGIDAFFEKRTPIWSNK